MLVIVAPGQGSQTPGFLAPWLELPAFRDRFAWLSAVADMDLAAHGTVSDMETIRDTAVAQPLIVATGLVAVLELFAHPVDGYRTVGAVSGHSVGEITAAAGAGVITAEQAMIFIRERSRGMARASAQAATGMTAVLGGDEAEVLATLERHGLTPANVNGGGQIVAAGTMEQLAALKDEPPAKARVIPLPVAGAFHTHHMAPAQETLAAFARAVSTHDPRLKLVSNRDGAVVGSGPDALARMVSQVSSPVRWDLVMRTFSELGVTGIIELPPAGTLVGLAKRALPGVELLALKTPEDLPEAMRMIREHGEPDSDAPLVDHPTWRMVIAPAKGIARLTDLAVGDPVREGQRVAEISTLRGSFDVTTLHDGRLVEWLVTDGDPVSPGQPLVRLHPSTEEDDA